MKSSYRLLVFAILLIAISVVGYSTPTITEKTEAKFDVHQMDVNLENVVVNDLFVLDVDVELSSTTTFDFKYLSVEEITYIDYARSCSELAIIDKKKSVRINRFEDIFKEADRAFNLKYSKEIQQLTHYSYRNLSLFYKRT